MPVHLYFRICLPVLRINYAVIILCDCCSIVTNISDTYARLPACYRSTFENDNGGGVAKKRRRHIEKPISIESINRHQQRIENNRRRLMAMA